MSIQNVLAKIYLRYFDREENEFDSLKTQKELSLPEPPKNLLSRCEKLEIGTADLLLWDCRKFYLKCLDAGVSMRYEEFPDAFHDFMLAGFLPETRKALKSQVEFLRTE